MRDTVLDGSGTGVIAFDARGSGVHAAEEIYLTDPYGAEIRRLTHTTPTWRSPQLR